MGLGPVLSNSRLDMKMSRSLYLFAALPLIAATLSVGAREPAPSHPSSSVDLTLGGVIECTSDDAVACSEAQKEYVREHVIKPKCGSDPGWACVTCWGEGSITVHEVQCGPPPAGCPAS